MDERTKQSEIMDKIPVGDEQVYDCTNSDIKELDKYIIWQWGLVPDIEFDIN